MRLFSLTNSGHLCPLVPWQSAPSHRQHSSCDTRTPHNYSMTAVDERVLQGFHQHQPLPFLGPWISWLMLASPSGSLVGFPLLSALMSIATASIVSEGKRQVFSFLRPLLSRQSSLHSTGSYPQPGTLLSLSITILYTPMASFIPYSRSEEKSHFLSPKTISIINERQYPPPFGIIHSPQAVLSHYKAHRDRQKPCQTGELNSQLWVFLSFQDQVVLHYLILFCTCHLSFCLTPSHRQKFKQSLNFRSPSVSSPKDPSLVFLNCIPEEMEEWWYLLFGPLPFFPFSF